MMQCKERQLQMEDAEDDNEIDDDDWEDMEIEENMENMVEIYLFFAFKMYNTYAIPQAESIRGGSSPFLKLIWLEMHHLMHLLHSLVIMNSNTRTECRECHSQLDNYINERYVYT